jgi:hypothetical protein
MVQMIFLIIVAIIIVTGLIWALSNRLMRSGRKADLGDYVKALDGSDGCEEAFEYFTEGLHISRMYGIPFPEVGCADETAFRQMAMNALEQSIFLLDLDYEHNRQLRDDPSLAYGSNRARSLDREIDDASFKAIKLRADLARLKLLGMSEKEQLKARNTFLTA